MGGKASEDPISMSSKNKAEETQQTANEEPKRAPEKPESRMIVHPVLGGRNVHDANSKILPSLEFDLTQAKKTQRQMVWDLARRTHKEEQRLKTKYTREPAAPISRVASTQSRALIILPTENPVKQLNDAVESKVRKETLRKIHEEKITSEAANKQKTPASAPSTFEKQQNASIPVRELANEKNRMDAKSSPSKYTVAVEALEKQQKAKWEKRREQIKQEMNEIEIQKGNGMSMQEAISRLEFRKSLPSSVTDEQFEKLWSVKKNFEGEEKRLMGVRNEALQRITERLEEECNITNRTVVRL